MMALAQDHLDRKMHSIIKGVRDMFGFNSTIKVACVICKRTFPVNEGMVDPKDTGLQPCWCPFCKRGSDVKVISVR